MPTDPSFWIIVITAVIISGLSKSGLLSSIGVVSVPLISLVMPARDAAGLMLPVLLAMDAIAVWSYRRDIDLNILKIMLPGAMIGIGLGWLMSSIVSDAWVLLVLGLITISFVLDTWFSLRKKLGRPDDGPAMGRFWGSLAGFVSFVSHSGGPPYQIYTLPKKLEPRRYAGTTAWFFAIMNFVKLVPFFFLGQLSAGNMQLAFMLMPLGIAAVFLGIFLVSRISLTLFYRIAYIGVFLVGLKLIYDGTTGLI